MNKRRETTAPVTLEEANRRDITDLKDALAELNTNLAVNTEVTKGLKEVMERELVRHVEERKGLESRVTVIEAKVDNVELKMAADQHTAERLANVEKLASDLRDDAKQKNGFWEGLSLSGRIFVIIGFPCIGWVVAEFMGLIHKALGMGP
jgi:hypothetical protein